MKRKEKAPVAVYSLKEQLMRKAQGIADKARIPRGARIVVAVTDVDGEWVGVGSNTNPHDIEAILRSALIGADRKNASVLEVSGEEIPDLPRLTGGKR